MRLSYIMCGPVHSLCVLALFLKRSNLISLPSMDCTVKS